MPLFFFDVTTSREVHRDRSGDELADAEQARRQARSILLDLMRESLQCEGVDALTCDVRDEVGRILYRGQIAFRGTLDPT